MSTLLKPIIDFVIPDTVPEKLGSVNISVFDSFVTLPNPTIVEEIPDTVPVNVGLASVANPAPLVSWFVLVGISVLSAWLTQVLPLYTCVLFVVVL